MSLPEGIPGFTPGRLRSNWSFRTQNLTSSAQPLLKPASAGTSTAGWRHLEATSVSAVPSYTKPTAPYPNTLPILAQDPLQEVIQPPGGAQDTPFSHSSMLQPYLGTAKKTLHPLLFHKASDMAEDDSPTTSPTHRAALFQKALFSWDQSLLLCLTIHTHTMSPDPSEIMVQPSPLLRWSFSAISVHPYLCSDTRSSRPNASLLFSSMPHMAVSSYSLTSSFHGSFSFPWCLSSHLSQLLSQPVFASLGWNRSEYMGGAGGTYWASEHDLELEILESPQHHAQIILHNPFLS